MNISQVIGSNIQTLMNRHNVSQRKLGEAIGVSHPTIKKYVEGSQPIDSEKLMRVALFFNKTFDYFFRQSHNDIRFLFRADKPAEDVNAVDLDRLKQAVYAYIDVFGEVDCQYVPQRYALNMSQDRKKLFQMIEKVALDQRRIANIENVIPDNYFESIMKIGIHVIVKDFHNNAYFGASSYSNDVGSYILVNDSENIPEERKIFSLIHEYAHLMFHHDQYASDDMDAFYAVGRSDPHEKVANTFAGYFLMPRHLVDEYIHLRSRIDPIEMKKHFKVSIQTLYLMLLEYKHISKKESDSFWKSIHYNGMRQKEPSPLDHIPLQQKNTRLINRIKDLYFKEEISANKISEVLGMSTLDTRKLLKEWRMIDERFLSLK